GDASGDWLWEALHRAGLAARPEARDLPAELSGAAITNAVKCVPPGNRPLASEVANCRAHLARELEAFRDVRVVVALGRVAHDAFLAVTGARRADHPFRHGAVHRIDGAPLLLDSFHPSPLNTRTGRLSRAAWRRLWVRAARLAIEPPPSWSVYLLRCGDGSLYTGVTTDLARRFSQHATGRGARYTRSRGAREIVWSEPAPSKSAALSREWQIKQLTRAQKLALAGL
ncbi:MAG TPA: uracil-DNA glycosylase family protein, partial [bacterium]|nr:uracil-DNA glycosylase family protein [bacterium]